MESHEVAELVESKIQKALQAERDRVKAEEDKARQAARDAEQEKWINQKLSTKAFLIAMVVNLVVTLSLVYFGGDFLWSKPDQESPTLEQQIKKEQDQLKKGGK